MTRLSPRQMLDLATHLPARPEPTELRDYVRSVRQLVDGTDELLIPESHRNISRGENHEGSSRLNARIRQLAAWFSEAEVRFSIRPSGPGQTVQLGASAQERFARNGEQMLSRGTGLHRWKHETYRDLAECGVSIIQQNSNRDYYTHISDTPELMAEGALLTDLIWRRRVDPATFAWEERPDGQFMHVTIDGRRHLGEIARRAGLEVAQRVLGFFDFGEIKDREDPTTWGGHMSVETTEVWGDENGGLVVTGGPKPTRSFTSSKQGRVITEWENPHGRPPFYIAAVGPWPWHSLIDEMVQLTGSRNYWAQMQDIQASGAIFRHWQLIDTTTGEDVGGSLPPDTVPEHLLYDPTKPPPFMGPGREWQLAPFEFHDVSPRYEQIRLAHESAGASVARLLGQTVGSETPVGTADVMESAARREFEQPVQAVQYQQEEMWRDLFRWQRTTHKDRILVFDMKRDEEGDFGFINTVSELTPDDVVTEHIKVTLDTRSRLAEFADYRQFVEMTNNGHMDYTRGVEQGLIPGVDDAQSEKDAIMVSEVEKIEAKAELQALFQQALRAAGLAPEQFGEQDTRFMTGPRVDPRGGGNQQGPDNVANTALAPNATDTLRAAS